MSVQPEEFLSQSPSAFLDQPSFLEQGPQPAAPARVDEGPDFAKIALGIAAALVVLRMLVKSELFKEQPRSSEEITAAAKRIYKRVLPAWLHVSVPAIAQAYRLGSTEAISYSELERMATDYAEELGDYVHESSILALADGFNAQVNAGWSERLAWQRAQEAYGLDAQQMRSYVKGLMSKDKDAYVTDAVPSSSRAMIDRLFLFRADRLGTNEAYRATQLGRNLVWLSLQASGQIPEGTQKRWVTAEDEKVCPVCAPLDGVVIPLHRRFSSGGRNFYSPGVHPNCRCWLEIVYPDDDLSVNIVKAMPGDPYDRDSEGQFARREERKAKPIARGLAKPLAAKPLEQAAAKPLEQAAATPLEARAASTLGDRRTATSIVSAENEAVQRAASAMLREAEEKEAAKQAAALSRALVEGDLQSAVAEAKRGLDSEKHRQKTIGFTRVLRPDDPQLHLSTVYVPADNYLIAHRLSPASLPAGKPISIGVTDPDTGEIEGIEGWHQEDENSGPGDVEGSDAFIDAFDSYLEQPEPFQRRLTNRKARKVDEAFAQQFADYDVYGSGADPKFVDQRKAMAGMTAEELIDFADTVLRNSEDARMYLELSDVMEDGPNEIANAIMWALHEEDRDNQIARARVGHEKNDSAWLTNLTQLAQDNDVLDKEPEEIMANIRVLQESYSDVQEGYIPTFFRITGWYGTIPPRSFRPGEQQMLTERGVVEGNYRVVGEPVVVPVPGTLMDVSDETGITRARIITLMYDPTGEGWGDE